MIKISGLWPTKAGTGWSGRSGNTRILVLPVDKTKTDNPRAPDYELLLSKIDEDRPLTTLPAAERDEPPPLQRQQHYPPRPATVTAKNAAVNMARPPEKFDDLDDEIPF